MAAVPPREQGFIHAGGGGGGGESHPFGKFPPLTIGNFFLASLQFNSSVFLFKNI